MANEKGTEIKIDQYAQELDQPKHVVTVPIAKEMEEEAKKQLTPRSGIDDLTTQVVSGRNKNESLIKSMQTLKQNFENLKTKAREN